MPASERCCSFCPDTIENVIDVLLHRTMYAGV